MQFTPSVSQVQNAEALLQFCTRQQEKFMFDKVNSNTRKEMEQSDCELLDKLPCLWFFKRITLKN